MFWHNNVKKLALNNWLLINSLLKGLSKEVVDKSICYGHNLQGHFDMLKFSSGDIFLFWQFHILALPYSDTFSFWHFHVQIFFPFWHFYILTLSYSNTMTFSHFDIPTLLYSDTFVFWHSHILTFFILTHTSLSLESVKLRSIYLPGIGRPIIWKIYLVHCLGLHVPGLKTFDHIIMPCP